MEFRDPVSSASHLLAAVWALYATLIMLRLTPVRSGRRPAVAVFGASMVFLYAVSGAFYGVPYTRTGNPDLFRFFQRVDQSAIFMLIASTNTPMIVVLLVGRWRRYCLVGMWAPTIYSARLGMMVDRDWVFWSDSFGITTGRSAAWARDPL